MGRGSIGLALLRMCSKCDNGGKESGAAARGLSDALFCGKCGLPLLHLLLETTLRRVILGLRNV